MDDFNWDDVKIAYQAAKLGSLSKAAAHCGVNYSTILRRIEQLENALGCKLFYRHQRGYQLTDAGHRLLSELPEIESRFSKLQSSLMGDQNVIHGNIKITILPEYSAFLHPILLKCQHLYPQLRLQVDVSNDILPLENGSAHISIRACENGDMQADLIAYQIKKLEYSYYASSNYVSSRGLPKSSLEYNEHSWVMPSGNKRKISFIKDMNQIIEQKNIAYQSNHFFDIQSAVEHGIGIGPIDDAKVAVNSGLQKVNSIVCNNENYLWFVYHKDLRDDLKIKVVAQLIKAQTQSEMATSLSFLDKAE